MKKDQKQNALAAADHESALPGGNAPESFGDDCFSIAQIGEECKR